MKVADNVYEVSKGDMVFVPSDSEHGIRNTSGLGGEEPEGQAEKSDYKTKSKGEDLRFLYVFAADGFDEIHYRFSESKPVAKL